MRKVVVELGVNQPKWIISSAQNCKDYFFYAFDPLPRYAEALAALENELPNYKFYNKAAWIKNETKTLKISGKHSSGSTIVDKCASNSHPGREVSVECIDLDAWVKATLSPDDYNILRADIEGSEYFLFPHMIEKGSMKYFKEVYYEPHVMKMLREDRNVALAVEESMPKWFAENGIPLSTNFANHFFLSEGFQQDLTSQCPSTSSNNT